MDDLIEGKVTNFAATKPFAAWIGSLQRLEFSRQEPVEGIFNLFCNSVLCGAMLPAFPY